MNTPLICFQNITKTYESFYALDSFSTELESGVIGLLGHNGAGKSTLLRILTQIYQPTSGKILIDHEELQPKHRNLFGYLPEDKGLYQDISLIDQLLYFATLKGVDSTTARARIDEWLEKFMLTDYRNKKIQHMSKGMQQKAQFIASIIHEPPVVVLDEPLSGLDPVNAQVINDYILQAKARGQMILFSTHRMEQAEDIADRIIMINQGKKVIDGDIRTVKKQHFEDKWGFGSSHMDELQEFLNTRQGLVIIETDIKNHIIYVTGSETAARDALSSIPTKIEITEFRKIFPSLQEIFIQYAS